MAEISRPTILSPIQKFLKNEAASGVILIACTIFAMTMANSSLGEAYHHFFHMPVSIGFGNFQLNYPLEFWINDFLMVIFFFMVGLEIKREIIAGELSDIKQASLPIAAAIGGMAVPAIIFTILNKGTVYMPGWGIPMATDIAFSLGILSLLGKRVPISLKIFLAALAIVDDLGAVLVIALFYTENMAVNFLAYGAIVFAILMLMNYLKVYVALIYGLLGLLLWYFLLKSGVHPTIAGVLLAVAIPAKRRIPGDENFLERLDNAVSKFRSVKRGKVDYFLTNQESHAVDEIIAVSKKFTSPLQNIEHFLQPWVAFFIMPVFAIANAGIHFEGNIVDEMKLVFTDSAPLGILLGLFFGKQIGVFAATWITVKSGLGQLSSELKWAHIYGVAILAGIGFTMSIFVAGLAYKDPHILNEAKMGIIVGSLLSAVFGYLFLSRVKAK